VFHGRGGYTYDLIYNMPIWLRNTTYNFIINSINQENEAQKQSMGKSTNKVSLDWANPDKSKLPK
jgi:hypothetical protein